MITDASSEITPLISLSLPNAWAQTGETGAQVKAEPEQARKDVELTIARSVTLVS